MRIEAQCEKHSRQSILRNIAASSAAKRVIETSAFLVDQNVEVNEARFWECVAEMAAAKIGCKVVAGVPDTPMGEDEARHFQTRFMPKTISTIFPNNCLLKSLPLSWLLLFSNRNFTANVARYVKSITFQRRMNEQKPVPPPNKDVRSC